MFAAIYDGKGPWKEELLNHVIKLFLPPSFPHSSTLLVHYRCMLDVEYCSCMVSVLSACG